MSEKLSRRELLEQGGKAAVGVGIAAAAPGWLSSGVHAETVSRPRRQVSPNEKVVLGLIGAGGMGCANMYTLMGKQEVEVAAICDVDESHLAEPTRRVTAKYGRAPQVFKDFRKLLEMKEINAVIIGTPDHWHALPTVLACEAGKDIYCEKPISHNIVEGIAMVNAARKYRRVVQVGTWQRSTQHFIDAIDYVRSGKLGKITLCRAWTLGHAGQGKSQPQNPPAGFDYDFWVGPAQWEPFQPNRQHGSFRWFFNYAGGLTGDWGVHMIDIALLAMSQNDHDLPMPTLVSSVGGKIVCGPDDDRTTPDTQLAIFQFNKPDGTPDWLLHWEVRVGGPGIDGGGHHGTEFIGQNGRLLVDREGWRIWTPDNKPLEKTPSPRRVNDHWQNWLDCIKSRELCRSDLYSMFQTTAVCHLANIAYRTGEHLEWDNAHLTIRNSRKAREDMVFQRKYRKPWSLPMHKA